MPRWTSSGWAWAASGMCVVVPVLAADFGPSARRDDVDELSSELYVFGRYVCEASVSCVYLSGVVSAAGGVLCMRVM